jgi:hypothetical protein
MKCAKCGFISFDHLSECKKCGTSLNQARTVLGFSNVEPAPPPFLKALVEEGGPVGAAAPVLGSGSAADAGVQFELADAEGPAFKAVAPSGQKGASIAVGEKEPHDEWAMDAKWLEEFDKKPTMDMPDVDDLLLELVDEDTPPRVGASAPLGAKGYDKQLAAELPDIEDPFLGLPDEDMPRGASATAVPAAKGFDKKPVVDIPEVDDLFLGLPDEDAPPRASAAVAPVAMDLDKDLSPLDLHADISLDDLVLDDLSTDVGEDFSLTVSADDLDLPAPGATKPADSVMELEGDLDDLALELGDDDLDLGGMELEESAVEK